MNKKKVLSLTLMILTSITLAQGQIQRDIGEQDGTSWIDQSDALKFGFVSGFLTGIFLMRDKALVEMIHHRAEDVYKKSPPTVKRIWSSAIETAESLSLYEITVGQIKDGLDAFYNDFSARKIKLVDAIYIVKMQINGLSPDLINAQIRYLKMQPIDVDVSSAITDKLIGLLDDLEKALKEGKTTDEELLKTGFFREKGGELTLLFCYGKY